MTKKLEAEGVRKIVVLAEDPDRWGECRIRGERASARSFGAAEHFSGAGKIPGVTAMIYDQECAAEKRRKRSRGTYAEPVAAPDDQRRSVCEGWHGDCVKQSNWHELLQPVMTDRGQKTRIHQSSCNKDYSCALGDCPSFVGVKIKPWARD